MKKMKKLISLDPSEPVRNPLETCGKGIVSYIPFKFSSQNLTNTALYQKLPTAYFYRKRGSVCGAKIRHWRKNSPFPKRERVFLAFPDTLRRATSRRARKIPLIEFHEKIRRDRPTRPKRRAECRFWACNFRLD